MASIKRKTTKNDISCFDITHNENSAFQCHALSPSVKKLHHHQHCFESLQKKELIMSDTRTKKISVTPGWFNQTLDDTFEESIL